MTVSEVYIASLNFTCFRDGKSRVPTSSLKGAGRDEILSEELNLKST